MVLPLARREKRRAGPDKVSSILTYAQLGWPSCPGAYPLGRGPRACSCDRLGCPDAGAHPISPAWQDQASDDPATLTRWWRQNPDANVILPTGKVFDALDVPAPEGARTLALMKAKRAPLGPVAAYGTDRYLFFVATRGAPVDEDEWWSCHLDCDPETVEDNPGLRWHCRNSYVLAPPSLRSDGSHVTWVVPPDGDALPDAVRVIDWIY